LSIVRGIGYYDGIVFEAYDKGGEDIGSIFGGGRYDKLCSIYGKRDIPATGVAGGIERLIISLERASIFPRLSQSPKIFVAAVNDTVRRKTMEIVQFLRNSGVQADFDLKRRTLAKQLEYADSMAIPFAIIVGQKEIEKGIVKLRDMTKREETEVKFEEVPKKILL
jgi:histidyl-tRNA synthetase